MARQAALLVDLATPTSELARRLREAASVAPTAATYVLPPFAPARPPRRPLSVRAICDVGAPQPC